MARFTTPSKYLKHTDISDVTDTNVTISHYEEELVGQGEDQEKKYVLYFEGMDKGLVLNKTNGKILCKMMMTDEMDHWVGQAITLYVKDDVQFGSDIVSAIRIRNKKPKPVGA